MAEQERQIAIQKIYTKDFSFESPKAPSVFTKTDWEPKTNLNLRSTHSDLGDDNHDVVLTLTVETKHEDETLFLVELHQAGIFKITGYEGNELAAVLGSFCPSTLFPYARESIANTVAKGGFPEFILQPINFDSLYAETVRQATEEGSGEAKVAASTASNGGNGGAH